MVNYSQKLSNSDHLPIFRAPREADGRMHQSMDEGRMHHSNPEHLPVLGLHARETDACTSPWTQKIAWGGDRHIRRHTDGHRDY